MKSIYKFFLTGAFVALATLVMAQGPEYGYAIYYADYFHGKKTANGETYDRYALTCAHKVHPFGTMLKVTRTDNYKSVIVKVNDRGPYNPGCVIDLSWAAADQIGLLLDGKVEVKVEVVNASTGSGMLRQEPAVFSQQTIKTVPDEYRAATAFAESPSAGSTMNRSFTETVSNINQGIRVPIEIPAKGTTRIVPSAASSPTAKGVIPTDVPVAYNAFSSEPAVASVPQVPAPALPTGNQGYSIQVGSYSYQPNAERQAQTIMGKGVQNVHVRKATGPNGTVYKILVGTYGSKTEANGYLSQLKSQHQLVGYVLNLSNL